MIRRQFLAAGAAALTLFPRTPRAIRRVRLFLRPEQELGTTPRNFLGLGFETSTVAYPGLLSGANRALINYISAMGHEGVIRIGGNTSDYAVWSPHGKAVSSPQPQPSVINNAILADLGRFLRAIGWKLIWGLNLGTGTPQEASEEAAAVAGAVGDALLALQIGNEPDLFSHNGLRNRNYTYPDYLREFQRFAKAIRKRLPNIPFAGPDVAVQTSWAGEFAGGPERPVLLTQHYYAEGPPANPAATIQNLLKPNERYEEMLRQLRRISNSARIPYRIVETNSCFGGGKPGVSDTFASALWGLDYCFSLAAHEAAGINFENGINQFGRVSCYSPIYNDEQGLYSARPLYYAMRAFSMMGVGQRLVLKSEISGINFKAYAVRDDPGRTWVTLINKEPEQAVEATISPSRTFASANAIRLTAPSMSSKSGVMLGGAVISNENGKEGYWRAAGREPLRVKGGDIKVHVPASSATFVEFG
ncbi:MAG: glycosyl hydrolase family 79 C-terminal domain-containing protein [Terriglobia bacterium]